MSLVLGSATARVRLKTRMRYRFDVPCMSEKDDVRYLTSIVKSMLHVADFLDGGELDPTMSGVEFGDTLATPLRNGGLQGSVEQLGPRTEFSHPASV
jgi:hypothetical protein